MMGGVFFRRLRKKSEGVKESNLLPPETGIRDIDPGPSDTLSSNSPSTLDDVRASIGADPEIMFVSPPDEKKDQLRYGWGPYTPNWLQRFNTTHWVVAIFCVMNAVQSMTTQGFIYVMISTIEKRFSFGSITSGLIVSAYYVSVAVWLVPISYLGGARHQPRWIGVACILIALASLLFVTPHFLTPPYTVYNDTAITDPMETTISPDNYLCNSTLTKSSKASKAFLQGSGDKSPVYVWIFITARLLYGCAAIPLHTLGVTFMDQNSDKQSSSLYLGIFYSMSVLGPALSYIMGGLFLNIYTDFMVTDIAISLDLSSGSPQWVGAWWIGFLLCAIVISVIAVPLLAFPKDLPGSEEIRQQKISEVHQLEGMEQALQPGFGHSLKDLPQALLLLMRNHTFLTLTAYQCAENLLASGFFAFVPKFIQSQFHVTASQAAFLGGAVAIPAGGGGTFLGGYLVKRFNLSCRGILKMCTGLCVSSMLLCICLFTPCDNIQFVGLNVPYVKSAVDSDLTFSAECNDKCNCINGIYDPVCGEDLHIYMSPCLAGCQSVTHDSDKPKSYMNCSCIPYYNGTVDIVEPQGGSGVSGDCSYYCNQMPVILLFFFLIITLTAMIQAPTRTALLRIVPPSQGSVALGVQWILMCFLGTIPGPIFFGYFIDHACSLWQQSVDVTTDPQLPGEELDVGSCITYDNDRMRLLFNLLAISLKFIGTLAFAATLYFYNPPTAQSDSHNPTPVTIPGAGGPEEGGRAKTMPVPVLMYETAA